MIDVSDEYYKEVIDEFPDVWFNEDTEEYECKTDEAAKWFVTHHKLIMSLLIDPPTILPSKE